LKDGGSLVQAISSYYMERDSVQNSVWGRRRGMVCCRRYTYSWLSNSNLYYSNLSI